MYPSGVTSSTPARPKRTYTGPWYSAAQAMTASVSAASAGTTTVILGNVRMQEISSKLWCVAPSSPTVIPA